MSMNYYLLLPIKPSFIKELKDLEDELSYNRERVLTLSTTLYDLKEEAQKYKIHLGKYSSGWSFLWDHNDFKYYEPTLASIKKFIIDNNAIIVDECGEKFNWEDFITNELGELLYTYIPKEGEDKNKVRFSHREYYNYKLRYRDNNNNYFSSVSYNKELLSKMKKFAKDGFVDTEFAEFHTKEGLRFATYTDFR